MSDISVTINPPNSTSVSIGNGTQNLVTGVSVIGDSTKTLTIYRQGADPVETTFIDLQNSGETSISNVVYQTGDQTISGAKDFDSRPTVGGTPVLLSGEAATAETGYLTGYVSKTETGNFLDSSSLSPYQTVVNSTGISGYLQGQISSNDSDITAINGASGAFLTTGAGDYRFVNVTGDTVSGNLVVTGYTSGQSLVLQAGGYVDFQGTNPSYKEGRIFYDTDAKTLCYYNDESDVTVNLGQEELVRVSNGWTGTITNGSVVFASGAQGNRPAVYLASASSLHSNYEVIGVATHDIINQGYVTTHGIVNGLNTTGFSEGAVVYLSSTSGKLTSTKPISPVHAIKVGMVIRSHQNQGQLYVNIDQGGHLADSHDVRITGIQNSDVLRYNSASGYWENQTLNTGVFALSSDTGNFLTVSSGDSRYVNATGDTINGDLRIKDGLIKDWGAGQLGIGGPLGANIYAAAGGLGIHTNVYFGRSFGVYDVSMNSQRAGHLSIQSTAPNAHLEMNGSGSFSNGLVVSGNSVITGESDPVFLASVAASIDSTLTGQWGTGYNDSITGISVAGTSSKTITLYQRDGSTLTANFTDIEGTGGAGNDYYLTGANFDSSNGDLTLYVNDGSTVVQSLDGRYVTGLVVRQDETGNFLIASDLSALEAATGNLDARLQTVEGITGDFVSSSETGNFATIDYVTGVSGYLQEDLDNKQVGILNLNVRTTAIENATGSFATTGYVTGVSGYLQGQISAINLTALETATGNLDARVQSIEGITGDFALAVNTGAFLTTGAGDVRYYPLSSNPSNYLVAADIADFASTGYVTGVSGYLQEQILLIDVPSIQSGLFNLNVRVSSIESVSGTFATTGYVTGVSGHLQGQIDAIDLTPLETATGILETRVSALEDVSGSFVLSSQTGNFITTGTSGYLQNQITANYNDSITGISVAGTDTKTITLYQQDGGTLSANFSDLQSTGGGGGGGGKVLQLVSYTESGTVSVSSANFENIFSGTITPTSSSSKILITTTTNIGKSTNGYNFSRIYYYNAAAAVSGELGVGEAAGNRTQVGSASYVVSASFMEQSNIQFLHSPNSTNELTYIFQINPTNAAHTAYLNRSHSDTDSIGFPRASSTITLMELDGS